MEYGLRTLKKRQYRCDMMVLIGLLFTYGWLKLSSNIRLEDTPLSNNYLPAKREENGWGDCCGQETVFKIRSTITTAQA
jgi:hypothetical protein